MKFGFDWPSQLFPRRRSLKNVNARQRTDAGPWVYYKLTYELIIKTLFKEEAQLDVHPVFPGVLI